MGWVEAVETKKTSKNTGRDVIVSYSPSTGETIGEVPIQKADEVRAAVARARAAQEAWALLPIEERGERMLRFRDVLLDRAEELVELLAREAGKPRSEGLIHEVMTAANLATFYAKRGSKILAPREIDLHLFKHRRSYVHYAPRGVIGIIAPWNFPFVIPFGDVIAALMAGNAVVLKPSEVTPFIALKGKELFDASGMSPDLFQIVTGDGGTGAALIDAGIDKLVFTGSVAVGKRVAAACAERLIPCTVELGGKAPCLVCHDADLELAARAIVFGGFANSGQVCVSVERVYAHESIYDKLVNRVTALTSELRQGDPLSHSTDVGAIIFPKQMEVAEKLIADAVQKGAQIKTGGKRKQAPGQFFEPTILAGCSQDMAVMREEIFGPVVPIMKVRDEEEAIRLANDSHLGLMGYVFTSDRDRGRKLAERIRAGTVMVNDVLSAYGAVETPFGGVRESGIGRVHGEEGLREMCEMRHVNYDRFGLPKNPFWYPYSERAYGTIKKAMKLVFHGSSPMNKLLDLF